MKSGPGWGMSDLIHSGIGKINLIKPDFKAAWALDWESWQVSGFNSHCVKTMHSRLINVTYMATTYRYLPCHTMHTHFKMLSTWLLLRHLPCHTMHTHFKMLSTWLLLRHLPYHTMHTHFKMLSKWLLLIPYNKMHQRLPNVFQMATTHIVP